MQLQLCLLQSKLLLLNLRLLFCQQSLEALELLILSPEEIFLVVLESHELKGLRNVLPMVCPLLLHQGHTAVAQVGTWPTQSHCSSLLLHHPLALMTGRRTPTCGCTTNKPPCPWSAASTHCRSASCLLRSRGLESSAAPA